MDHYPCNAYRLTFPLVPIQIIYDDDEPDDVPMKILC